ncbi:hypothetical protein BRAS3843_180009 [Bradyrhizobium sp. STM 3843]|nr:hypothetical protein BRAS3843_180009 [Bradyrhizobium sp. STM 3843]
MAPDPLLTVHLAKGVMQHHIGRACGVRTGIVADDGIEAEQRLHEISLEHLVQHLAGRAGEEIQEIALLLDRQRAQRVGRRQRIEALADRGQAEAFDQVWRRAQHEAAQHVRDRLQSCREQADRVSIMRAEPGHRRLCAALAGQEIAAVGGRQEILRPPFDDLEPALMQLEIGDDLRIEQADRVGCDRIAKARMKFLGHGGPADHLAPLHDVYAQARHGQIGGTGQAVMAGSNDDDVGFVHVRFKKPWLKQARSDDREPVMDSAVAPEPYAVKGKSAAAAGRTAPPSVMSGPRVAAGPCAFRCWPEQRRSFHDLARIACSRPNRWHAE